MPARNDGECLRCGGRLERGHSRDTGHGGSNHAQVWLPGEPQFGWFGGLKVTGKELREGLLLEAWRCGACAHVEWFAREKKQ